jgi:hypothetical protein
MDEQPSDVEPWKNKLPAKFWPSVYGEQYTEVEITLQGGAKVKMAFPDIKSAIDFIEGMRETKRNSDK